MEIEPVGDANAPPASALYAGPISQQPGTTGTPTAPAPDLGTTPVEAPNTAGGAAATLTGVNPALATTLAKAIALGLAQAPTSQAGWASLIDKFDTTGGENEVTIAEQQKPTATNSQQTATTTPGAPASGGASGINAFLAAIRQHESGGNYQAYNAGGGASGAYQFIQSTWDSEAKSAGYGQYAGKPAGDAPPAVQDAVAAHMAQGYFSQYNNWADVAEAWYDPALVGQNVVPDPQAGNTETVAGYGNQIVQMMGQMGHFQDPGSPATSTTAPNNVVKIAQGQLGTPYVWGGESAGKAFDCSGLVQWVYGQAGDTLPRTAQEQYNATPHVASGANLQPGDLLFFGSGPSGVEHVGIYIGNGQMIDAPHTGADVRVDTVFAPGGKSLWANFVGATRPADPTGTTTAAPNSPAQQTIGQGQSNYGAILESVITNMARLSRTDQNQRDQRQELTQEIA